MRAYNTDKAVLHCDRLAVLRNGEQPYPVHVQLIISDYCNQNCQFCSYRTPGYSSNELFHVLDNDGEVNNNPRRMLPWSKIQEIITDCKKMGVRAIQITGGGEPTLHPQFNELCEMVLDQKMDLAVVTNGLLINEKRSKILAEATWARISVDAGNAETYAKIRSVPPQEYGIVEKNFRRLAKTPNKKAYLGVGYVITKENYTEIFEGCRNFKDWGAENVRLSAVFQNDGSHYYNGFYDEVQEQIKQTLTLNDETFRVFNNFGSRYDDLQQGTPDYQACGYMHLTTYIGADQYVYTCCVNAYNHRGQIGSLKDMSFKDLWDSQHKHDFFQQFDARDCSRCMFNEKNRHIQQLVQLPTSHDNFV